MLILPAAIYAQDLETYTAKLPTGDWEPSREQLISALDHLKHDYPLWVKKIGRDIKPWYEYRFQYYGIHENGKRILFLNAFCSAYKDLASNWRTQPVIVDDGGSCFFQAKFDVVAGKIVYVSINGEA